MAGIAQSGSLGASNGLERIDSGGMFFEGEIIEWVMDVPKGLSLAFLLEGLDGLDQGKFMELIRAMEGTGKIKLFYGERALKDWEVAKVFREDTDLEQVRVRATDYGLDYVFNGDDPS